MAEVIKLTEEVMQIDFRAQSKSEQNPRARVRALALMHVKEGASKMEASKAVGLNRGSVIRAVKEVNARGLKGLLDQKRSGRPPILSPDLAQEFEKRFIEAQKVKSGGRLTGYDAQKILNEMGVQYKLAAVYNVLHKLNLSWVTSRSAHPQQNLEAQEEFKKNLYKK